MARAERYGRWCQAVSQGDIKPLAASMQDSGTLVADREILFALGVMVPSKSVTFSPVPSSADAEHIKTEITEPHGTPKLESGEAASITSIDVDERVASMLQPPKKLEAKRKAEPATPLPKKKRGRVSKAPAPGTLHEVRARGKKNDEAAVRNHLRRFRESTAFKEMDDTEQEEAVAARRTWFMEKR